MVFTMILLNGGIGTEIRGYPHAKDKHPGLKQCLIAFCQRHGVGTWSEEM